LFVTLLFIAILLSIPGQSYWVLGVELVALAVIIGRRSSDLGSARQRRRDSRRSGRRAPKVA
jgi:hypothetical protein